MLGMGFEVVSPSRLAFGLVWCVVYRSHLKQKDPDLVQNLFVCLLWAVCIC